PRPWKLVLVEDAEAHGTRGNATPAPVPRGGGSGVGEPRGELSERSPQPATTDALPLAQMAQKIGGQRGQQVVGEQAGLHVRWRRLVEQAGDVPVPGGV